MCCRNFRGIRNGSFFSLCAIDVAAFYSHFLLQSCRSTRSPRFSFYTAVAFYFYVEHQSLLTVSLIRFVWNVMDVLWIAKHNNIFANSPMKSSILMCVLAIVKTAVRIAYSESLRSITLAALVWSQSTLQKYSYSYCKEMYDCSSFFHL